MISLRRWRSRWPLASPEPACSGRESTTKYRNGTWRVRSTCSSASNGAEFGLLAVALIIAGVSGRAAATTGTLDTAKGADAFSAGITYVLALVLAVAMGIQNSVARKLAVPDLTTTVPTMTLTGIGAGSPAGQRGHVTLIRRLLVVATMLAGGVLGAWLVLNVGVVVPLALATGLLVTVAACAVHASRNSAGWRPVAPAKPVSATASAPAQMPPPNRGWDA